MRLENGAVRKALVGACMLSICACEGPAGPAGDPGTVGQNGAPCTATDNNDGTYTVDCPGSGPVIVSDGSPGQSCTVTDNSDGTYTINCPGSASVVVQPPQTPAAFDSADAVRGAKLYDKFWAVDGVNVDDTASPVADDHPLYPAASAKSGSTTWRCKECHGWDYIGRDGRYSGGSHFTGIAGLLPVTLAPVDVFDVIKTGHGYGATGLTDVDIWDLVKFYREGIIDIDSLIDSNGAIGGDVVAGQALYETPGGGIGTNAPCGLCHGNDGFTELVTDFNEWPGLLANDNPQEFLHKVRFGHPGSISNTFPTGMPAAFKVGATVKEITDLSAYVQTMAPDTAYANADAARGGQLYDKFWAVAGVNNVDDTASPVKDDHPLYPAGAAKSGSTTWRCKECHGWDYIGKDGRYSDGSHYTGIDGLFPPRLTLFDTFEVIKTDHGYGGTGLTDADIWDLVAFYQDGMIDIPFVMNSDGSFRGDEAGSGAGQVLFETGTGTGIGGSGGNPSCGDCHGNNGLTQNASGIPNDFIEFPGLLSNDNPQEFIHKVRFGHPGTAMPSAYKQEALGKATLQDVADVAAWSQILDCNLAGNTWLNGSCSG